MGVAVIIPFIHMTVAVTDGVDSSPFEELHQFLFIVIGIRDGAVAGIYRLAEMGLHILALVENVPMLDDPFETGLTGFQILG